MGIDKIKKSNRLLQSRRYTQENLNDAQEAFSRVLDLNASEIFIDQNLVPYVDLPFSGSSQSGSIFTSGSKDIAKYYYRHSLTPATTASSFYEVWFFLDPTSSVAVDPQIIQPDQRFNFISPKYSSASLTLSETEAPTPGYNVVIYTGSSMAQILAGSGKKVSANDYQFDYKTGILQFGSNPPPSTAFVTITAYQYLGDTLDKFIASGSGGGTGTGFPFSGSASITGSLTVSGSGITVNGGTITLITSSITSTSSSISFTTGSITITSGSITVSTGSFIGNLTGTASWANNVVSASYATNAQNILPTLFQIPELGNVTGSGLIISSSTLPANHYNAIRIGNSELVDDLSGFFTFNIGTANGWAFSGSIGGLITTLNQNNFNFYEGITSLNFRSNPTDFTVFKSQSGLNTDDTIAFNVNRRTGLLYTSGGASISGSANIQNNLAVGGTLSAGASTLNSLTVTNLTTLNGNLVVNGTASFFGSASFVNVDNLLVEDKFILLNSGSTGGIPNEGGIIVQTTSSEGTAYGTALYYDQEANRWVVNRSSSVAWNATSNVFSTSSDFIVTVTGSAGTPTGTPVNFGTGDSLNSIGQMYINTSNSDIYIYA